MEQTFNDVLQERAEKEVGFRGLVLWMFVETSAGIVRENMTGITMQKRIIVRAVLMTVGMLLIPLTGVLVASWNWDIFDFAVMGAVIFSTGLAYQLVARKVATFAYRAAAGIALVTAFLIFWVNAAVGIIGDGPVNLMYLAVLLIGAIGAIIAGLEPQRMSRALFVTAFAMALVPVIALIVGVRDFAPGVGAVFVVNSVFVLLFVASALLFRAASTQS